MNRKSVPILGSFSLPIFCKHPVVTSRCLTFGHHKRYQSVTPFLGPQFCASVPPGLASVWHILHKGELAASLIFVMTP